MNTTNLPKIFIRFGKHDRNRKGKPHEIHLQRYRAHKQSIYPGRPFYYDRAWFSRGMEEGHNQVGRCGIREIKSQK